MVVKDEVFKALADPTRREVLDRLRAQDGQTLGQLCERLEMARQSVTQHVDLLRDAGLVSVVRRGRERLHYLNPAPIHELQDRWISTFDRPRLDALAAVRAQAERNAMNEQVPDYVYVTYIKASQEQVWQALTDADLTAEYWRHRNESDWCPGSTWQHLPLDGGSPDIVGTVLEADPPNRLLITFVPPGEEPSGGPSIVRFELEPMGAVVRLSVLHGNLPSVGMLSGISTGWPIVLANLKSLLETGSVLPDSLWQPILEQEGSHA